MEDENARKSRIPTIADLVMMCRSLNQHKAKYIVIGGLAIAHHGYLRATGDIDLLVDPSPANIEKIRPALSYLPDRAVLDVKPEDVRQYTVVRIGDELTVDLMGRACDVTYEQAKEDIDWMVIDNVRVPFLGVKTLILTKRSIRPQDVMDRQFLQEKLNSKSD
ncbi:MAG: hypothetical protein HY283_06915 [Nitrospirae bacterium]|nr:hypothetical protein [Nitrospirota bacterium]